MKILSVPFRFRYGSAVTVDQATDESVAEMIAVLCRTHRGERPLVPNFGITDPAFNGGVDANELRLGVLTFGPRVAFLNVDTRAVTDEIMETVIRFE